MTIFRREKRRTEGNTFLNKRKRISIRVMDTFKATKPNRDTLFTECEERKEG